MIYDLEIECGVLGQRIREFCEMRGMTQYILSQKAQVSNSGLNSIVRGATKPSIYTLLRICNALGIRIQDLLVGGKKQEDEPSSYPLDRLQADELFAGTSLDERQWLYKYRYLPDVDQKKAQDYMVQLSIERWGENYDSCRYAETEEKGDWDADGGEALKDVSDI